MNDVTARVIGELSARKLTIAVAESLTGGILTGELIRPAGASVVVLGGIVAYNSELKRTLLNVDADLLVEFGAVHEEVACQMARGVRQRLSVAGRPADIGVATTGVAGPGPKDGILAGTVILGLSMGDASQSRTLTLHGGRDEVRLATSRASISWLAEVLGIEG